MPPQEPTDTGQYFDASPRTRSSPRTVPLVLPDLTVDLRTDRSVFSGDRIDPGTRYLLLEAPHPDPHARHVLDLGCGYGPIAIALARRVPGATVWAVEVNERAVALCRENAIALGCDNLHVTTATDANPFGAVPDDVRFDAIYSNPPIRVGKEALHKLLRRWLGRLTPEGHAYLVVQKHLGSDSLQRWLVDEGWASTRFGSRAGYRILEVTRGAATP